MATIKALRLRGFKSFPKQVEIPFGDGYNIVIGPNGSGKSCSYNTIITLSDGQEIKIGDLVEEKLKTGWLHRELDDGVHCRSKQPVEVLSLNPWSMKEEGMYVSQFIKREGEPYLFEITTNTGKKVRTTGCHPVIVFKDGQVTSSLVKNLKEGSLIASPRVIHTNGLENEKNFARLFGYLVGDGYLRTDSIQFGNNTKEIIDDVKDLMKKLFNATPYESNGKNNYTKLIYRQKNVRKNVLDLIRNNEEKYTTEHKYIPNHFLNKDIETITHLLAGLFDTDGHINKKNPIIEFTTKNERLANQIQQLLLRIGIIARKKKRMCSATNTVNKIKRPYYYLYIESQENLCRFYINIPLRCKYKKERLEKHIKNKIVSNMNIDVLPRETNLLIRKAVELLGINVKSFKKKIPRLAAYMENRCSPTREGLKIVLLILTDKLLQIKEAGLELHRDQFNLVQTMDQLNISGASASKAINLNKQIIRDCWATGKFTPTSRNLNNFFNLSANLEKIIHFAEITKPSYHYFAIITNVTDEAHTIAPNGLRV